MDSGNIYTNNPSTSQILSSSYLSDSGIPTSSTDYILPRQLGTGSTRGTQTIGVGSINLNGSTNQITIGQTSISGSAGASIVIGQQSSTSSQSGVAASSISTSSRGFGFSTTDTKGNTLLVGVLNNGDIGFNISDASGNSNITIDGTLGYQLFTDPTTEINQLVIGLLPDGTYGMVISKPGINVLSVFT